MIQADQNSAQHSNVYFSISVFHFEPPDSSNDVTPLGLSLVLLANRSISKFQLLHFQGFFHETRPRHAGTLPYAQKLVVDKGTNTCDADEQSSSLQVAKTIAGEDLDEEEVLEMDAGRTAREEGRFVFECAWEVANKVGGIYTVLRSKAQISTEELGDQYCMFGPMKDGKWRLEVDPIEPENRTIRAAMKRFQADGFRCMYGRWLIEGYPKVILFDLGSGAVKMNEWKHELYEKCKIGIPHEDIESNDAVILGFMVAIFLQHFRDSVTSYRPLVVAHFHEWQAGVGLLMTRLWKVDVATVYTTHATLLGRHLCAGGADLYNNLDSFDLDAEAGKRKIYHQYCLERAACQTAHVFTTVSEITGLEAKHFLCRKPDILTPNGLNVVKFAALHEFQNLHAQNKEKINQFIRGHFHGHLDFDIDKTLYFFTAGRYEFSNKGGDMFIESLARLNHYLQTTTDPRHMGVTVVAFLIYPAPANSFNVESLKGQAVTKQLKEAVDRIKEKVGQRIFDICLQGHLPDPEELLSPADNILVSGTFSIEQMTTFESSTLVPLINTVPAETMHHVTAQFEPSSNLHA